MGNQTGAGSLVLPRAPVYYLWSWRRQGWESSAQAAAHTTRSISLSSGFRAETPHAGVWYGLTGAVKTREKEGRAMSSRAATGCKQALFTQGYSDKALGTAGRSQTMSLNSIGTRADYLEHPEVLSAVEELGCLSIF